MKKTTEQQRNAERIPLKEPIEATIDSAEASVIELSLIGAKVEHFNRLAMNSIATVQFKWKGQTLRLKGKVARTEMRSVRGKAGYMSGITFATSAEEGPQELRWMMGTLLEPIPHEPEPPPPPPPKPTPPPQPSVPYIPSTTPAPFLQQIDEIEDFEEIEPAAEMLPYVSCVWEEEEWIKTRTSDPKQPLSGFTMLAPETDEEVDDFCRTYEMADIETQRMIRLSFELSITHYRRK